MRSPEPLSHSLLRHHAGLRTLLVAAALWCGLSCCIAQRSSFTILKRGQPVGSILASRLEIGDRSTYLVTSYTEIDVVFKQVVRTSMAVEYRNGTINSCRSTMHVNDGLRDSSEMSMRSGQPICFVSPGPPFPREGNSKWTTARMYFEEPIGQKLIFVESVLQECVLRAIGANTYELVLPNKNTNRYIYVGGVLQQIQVDRTLIDLVFQRT